MMSVPELKMALLDSFWGTERGLNASSDARAEVRPLKCHSATVWGRCRKAGLDAYCAPRQSALTHLGRLTAHLLDAPPLQIVELITQLEANNPTPLPNETQELLDGTWKLVYTSNSEVLALLGLSRLPFVEVGDITQTVDGSKMTVENKVGGQGLELVPGRQTARVDGGRAGLHCPASTCLSIPYKIVVVLPMHDRQRLQRQPCLFETPPCTRDLQRPQHAARASAPSCASPRVVQVQLSGPLVRTSFATSASVEVRSPKLLQVQFQEGRVATPELLQDVELPASLELAGQQVDLKPLQVREDGEGSRAGEGGGVRREAVRKWIAGSDGGRAPGDLSWRGCGGIWAAREP